MELLGLLAETHGAAFRMLCESTGFDGDGLTIVARVARKRGFISSAMAKKCEKLDIAYAVSRHLTKPRASTFVRALQ